MVNYLSPSQDSQSEEEFTSKSTSENVQDESTKAKGTVRVTSKHFFMVYGFLSLITGSIRGGDCKYRMSLRRQMRGLQVKVYRMNLRRQRDPDSSHGASVSLESSR